MLPRWSITPQWSWIPTISPADLDFCTWTWNRRVSGVPGRELCLTIAQDEQYKLNSGVFDYDDYNSVGKATKRCHGGCCGYSRLAVTVRFRHCVPIRSAILAIVHTVRGIPSLVVHGTVETLWDSVLGKNVGVEEYLRLISCRTDRYDKGDVRMA